MNSIAIALLVIGIAALVAVLASRRQKSRGPIAQEAVTTPAKASGNPVVTDGELEAVRPTEVHFGADLNNPAVTLRPLPLSEVASADSAPEVKYTLGVASRISSLMQAVPSLLVAGAQQVAKPAEGRQLMEVVINGRLIRAADGDGFRAMTKHGTKINEHAKLYEAKDITTLVNAAAVWQLASVIVAQKHMADISQKLGEIKEAVSNISDFLDSARRAVIHGTYEYLQQAYATLSKGELSPAIRVQLESCEIELLKVQNHLIGEIQLRTEAAPKDEDTFGTESLHKNSMAKYRELLKPVNDLKLCIRTRSLAWYVLSLYPGEQALKAARWESIDTALSKFRELQAAVDGQARRDADRFKAMWNSDNTLGARKSEVLEGAQSVQRQLSPGKARVELLRMRTSLQERDTPTQLIVELFDGKVLKVRQRELQR